MRHQQFDNTIDTGYMKYTAIVPVKSLAQAKSRLAPYLSSSEREELVLDLERLRRNAREKTLAWGRGSELQERQVRR
jgi:hypothetical protein